MQILPLDVALLRICELLFVTYTVGPGFTLHAPGKRTRGGGGLYILPSTSFYNPYLLVFLLSIPFLKYVNNLFYPHSGVLFEQHLTPGSEISFLKICLTPSGTPKSIRGGGGKNTIPFFAYLVHKIQR